MKTLISTLFTLGFFGSIAFAQWAPLNPPTNSQMGAVSFANANTGLIGGTGGELYKTTDGGTTWTTQTSGITENIFSIEYVNPTTAYACASSGTGVIIKTTDGGATWTSQTFSGTSYLLDLYFPSDSVGYCVGYNGVIMKTTDWGANWTFLAAGTGNDLRSVFFTDENTGYVAMSSGNVMKTIDGGATWTTYATPASSMLLGIYFGDALTGYAVGSVGQIVKTTDGGLNWTLQTSNTSEFLQGVHFVSANQGYAVGGSGVIVSTTDGGATWNAQYHGSFSGSYGWYDVTFVNGEGYVSGFGGEVSKKACPASTGTDTQVACASYTWIDGNTYTSSNNTATYSLTSASGCDSIVTLDLTINAPSTGIDTQVACGSYTWIDGNTYTTSNNTATYTLANASGCDSIVTLDLTINAPSTGTDTQVACGSYTWIDGNTYTTSNNTATYTLANASGCDSIVTLDLTINTVDVSVVNNDPTIVANASGVSYQWIDCSDNSIIAGETNQSFSASSNGDYAVIISDGSCTDTSDCVTVTTVGVESLLMENSIVVYPNPSDNGLFTVDLSEIIETVDQVYLINSLGQVIMNGFKPTEGKLSVEAIDAGVYLLVVEMNGGEQHTIRLVSM